MKKLSVRQQKYCGFWEKLIKKFNEEKFFEERPKAKISETVDKHYLQLLIRKGGIHFEWFLVGYPINKFQVALHFEREDFNENKELLNYFKSRKEEFKNDFEEELKFGSHNEISTHMFLEIETDSMDKDTIEWGVKTMIKFYDTLKPILDEELIE